MFTYAQVESALMTAFGVREESKGAFRARINNFQKLRLVPASPGKGKKIEYTFENVLTWAVAVELSEFNIDPSKILYIISMLSHTPLWRGFMDDSDSTEDKYLLLHPCFVSKWSQVTGRQAGPAPIRVLAASKITAETIQEMKGMDRQRRVAMFNFSELRRDLQAALDAAMKGDLGKVN
jgi:hypothetical protein